MTTSRRDGDRYQAYIMLAETDSDFEDETEPGETDNG